MPFPIERNAQDAGRGVGALLWLVPVCGIIASVFMLRDGYFGALPYCGLFLSGVVLGVVGWKYRE